MNELAFAILVGLVLFYNSEQRWNSTVSKVYVNFIMASMIMISVISIVYAISGLIRLYKNRRKLKPKTHENNTVIENEKEEKVDFSGSASSHFNLKADTLQGGEETKFVAKNYQEFAARKLFGDKPQVPTDPATKEYFRKKFERIRQQSSFNRLAEN